MHKKILGICTALVAFAAFAVLPAVASASPVLTEGTTAVATGSKITATGKEEADFVAGGSTVKCNENWMTGTVVTNSGSLIEGTIESAKFESNYNASGTKCDGGSLFGETVVTIPALTNEGGTGHWCVKSGKTDTWEIQPHGCGGTGGEFKFTLSGLITCTFSRTSSITGTFVTNEEPAKLTVTGNPTFTGSGFFCPASGEITNMAFKLYTDNAEEKALKIS